jgi:hypothetical protein
MMHAVVAVLEVEEALSLMCDDFLCVSLLEVVGKIFSHCA